MYFIAQFRGKVFVLSVKVLLSHSYSNKWVNASSFIDRRFVLTILTFCRREFLSFLKFNPIVHGLFCVRFMGEGKNYPPQVIYDRITFNIFGTQLALYKSAISLNCQHIFDDVTIFRPKIKIFGPKKAIISNGHHFLQGPLE